MTSRNKEILKSLESIICVHVRPHFLSITEEDGVFSVIISHPSFLFMTMPERVSRIFDLIRIWNPDILKQGTIVVQAFDGKELEDIFQYWVDEDDIS